MIADRHLHTWFSTDSDEDPENCVKKAIKLGMKDLWFTDHYDIDFPEGLFVFDVDEYFRQLTALKKKYEDMINVHIGVELGLKKDIGHKIKALLEKYPFEYSIGSIHLIDGLDPYEREKFDIPDEEFYGKYFETALECLESCSGFNTFGHLDYVVRYGHGKDETYSYGRYSRLIDAILEHLIKKDIALEINTAGVRKGLRYVHPYPDVLNRFRELGGRLFAFGSDAHRADDVGFMFDETYAYLNNTGFKNAIII